jgi:hypothetical protein
MVAHRNLSIELISESTYLSIRKPPLGLRNRRYWVPNHLENDSRQSLELETKYCELNHIDHLNSVLHVESTCAIDIKRLAYLHTKKFHDDSGV